MLERLKHVRLASRALAAVLVMWLPSCGGEQGVHLRSADERNRVDGGVSPTPAPVEPGIAASVAVGDFPQDVAVVGNHVWVLVHDQEPVGSSLVAVDASTSEITRQVRLHEEVTRIFATPEALWMAAVREDADGPRAVLLRMNPRNGEVTARFPSLRDPLTYGDGALWATSQGDRPGASVLVRINPETAQIETTIEIPGLAVYMAAGAGAVWVMAYEMQQGSIVGGRILRVDSRSGAVTEAFPGGDRTTSLPAVAGGFVWIPGEDDGQTGMFRLDPETGQVVGEPLVFGTSISSPAGVSHGGIWYIGDRPGGQVISRLNMATGEFDAFLGLDHAVARSSIDLAATLAPDGESLWVANHRRSVSQIDLGL